MSFYIVPTMSYQQKQKMKAKPKKSSKSGGRLKPQSTDTSDDVSLRSEPISERPESAEKSFNESPSRKTTMDSAHSEFLQRRSNNSRRQSESAPSLLPSISSRRASWVSEGSRASSIVASIAGFTASKLPVKVAEQPLPANETGEAFPKAPSHAEPESPVVIPEYVPFTDLSVFNSEEAMRKAFLNPKFVLQRFEMFLGMIQDHHVNDPINFATVREQSLRKFLRRRNVGLTSHWSEMSPADRNDKQQIEDLLSHELLKCRSVMRSSLKSQLDTKSCYRKLACEQLIQGNFQNYVRYIITLPECPLSQQSQLSKFQKKDYEIKRAFFDMADALFALRRDSYEGDISTAASRIELLLQSITKTSFDFILLEKYTIQILMKLTNDFLIESRITRHLFDLFNLNMQLGKRDALKVLVFNSALSANYSWYLATTIPFLHIFEASLLNENASFNQEGKSASSPSPVRSSTTSLDDNDQSLYQTYFSKLNLGDFSNFCQMTRKDLVDLQRSLSLKTSAGKMQVKPINFEYYSRPMSTVRSETFHVVQCRDLMTQVLPVNRPKLLKEFHRLLKTGGVLELPLLISGAQNLSSLDKFLVEMRPDSGERTKAEWEQQYELNSVKDIIVTLGEMFGSTNVKFSSLLLTSKSKMSSFLIKHTAMSIHESLSEIDQFEDFVQTARSLERMDENDLHFYVYIRAGKA